MSVDGEATQDHQKARPTRVLRVIVAVALVALTAYLVFRSSDEDLGRLPEVELAAVGDGDPIDTADLRGRPVIINYWASWCDPCRREMPLLDRAYRQHAGELLIIGVAVEDTMANLEEFRDEVDVSYPLVADLDKVLYTQLVRIQGLPQTFFVDASGRIIDEGPAAPIAGELDEAELQEAIAFLLR